LQIQLTDRSTLHIPRKVEPSSTERSAQTKNRITTIGLIAVAMLLVSLRITASKQADHVHKQHRIVADKTQWLSPR